MRMLNGRGVRAFLTAHPWTDCYELRLVHDAGARVYGATEIVEGAFKYEEIPEGAELAPVLRLGSSEIDAILEALKQHARPTDATIDALRDTREIRDRLLTLIEARWK